MEELLKKMRFAKKGIDKILTEKDIGVTAWDVGLWSEGNFYTTLWDNKMAMSYGIRSDTLEGLIEQVKEWSGKCQ